MFVCVCCLLVCECVVLVCECDCCVVLPQIFEDA